MIAHPSTGNSLIFIVDETLRIRRANQDLLGFSAGVLATSCRRLHGGLLVDALLGLFAYLRFLPVGLLLEFRVWDAAGLG